MRIAHHAVRYQQLSAVESLSGAQDEDFFEAQLLRSISLALSAVGFDSVKPTALESFRAEVDQYMLHFLATVRSSMLSNRRAQPIPQDFIAALSELNIKPHELIPHIRSNLDTSITQPPLTLIPSDEPTPPKLDSILGPDLAGLAIRQKYMPAHLPELPSRHTWQDTHLYTERERDARKIRELATEEGVLAEQAMRKLMTSAVPTKSARDRQASKKDQMIWEETMDAIMQIDEEQRLREEEAEWDGDGMRNAADHSKSQDASEYDSAMLVNYDKRYWRKAAQDA